MNPVNKILRTKLDVGKNRTNIYLSKRKNSTNKYGNTISAYTPESSLKGYRKNVEYPKRIFINDNTYINGLSENENIEQISDTLHHEELHHAIANVAGIRASIKFDNIVEELNWKEAYWDYQKKYGKVAADKAFGLR